MIKSHIAGCVVTVEPRQIVNDPNNKLLQDKYSYNFGGITPKHNSESYLC